MRYYSFFIVFFLVFIGCANKNVFVAQKEYLKKVIVEKVDTNFIGYVNKKINIENKYELSSNDKYKLFLALVIATKNSLLSS